MRHPEADSFYDLLGVCRDATPTEIRAAFLKMAERHHPDLHADDPEADQQFKRIRRVYEILRDPIQRAAYDDHPHHFRLNDADVLGRDTGPIVTYPMPIRPETSTWSDVSARRAGSGHWPAWRPAWRADRRFARESRFAFPAVMATMVALAAVCIVLIRSRGDRSDAARPTISEPIAAAVATPETPTGLAPVSPLEQVISSVRDLRADSASDRANDAQRPTGEHAPASSESRPSVNIMDELNLPFPGWPLVLPPIDVPLFEPQRHPETENLGALPPGSDAMPSRVEVREPGWSWTAPPAASPSRAASPPSTNSAPAAAPSPPHWDSPDPTPTGHVVRSLPNEREAVWHRATDNTSTWPAHESGSVVQSSADRGGQPAILAQTGRPSGLPVAPPPVIVSRSPFVRPIVRQLLPTMPVRVSSIGPLAATTSYEEAPHQVPIGGVQSGMQWPTSNDVPPWQGAPPDQRWNTGGGLGPVPSAPMLTSPLRRPSADAQIMAAGAITTEAMRMSSAVPPNWAGLPMNGQPPAALPSSSMQRP